MGQTIAKAAEFTSVAESGEKKLALVKTNEDILNKIITFVEQYPGEWIIYKTSNSITVVL